MDEATHSVDAQPTHPDVHGDVDDGIYSKHDQHHPSKDAEASHPEDMHMASEDDQEGYETDDEETACIHRVLNSFYGYGIFHHRIVTNRRRRAFFALPSMHQQLLTSSPFSFVSRFQDIEDAIDENTVLSKTILMTGLLWAGVPELRDLVNSNIQSISQPEFEQKAETTEESDDGGVPQIPGLSSPAGNEDYRKTSSTLRQLYREWSAEGATERKQCFDPIMAYLDSHFRDIPKHKRHTTSILNPGCGLGRFVFDLACAGYTAEGCELSYHQSVTSMHIMNFTERAEQHRFYPFVLGGANHLRHSDRIQSVRIPDIYPRAELEQASELSEVPGPERLGISQGDFSVVFKRPKYRYAYDAIVTIFFLDTAPNPLSYIETVVNCLKPGGLWLNLGPLKWHWESDPIPKKVRSASPSVNPHLKSKSTEDWGVGNPGAVELTEEDVIHLLDHYGFDIMHHETGKISTGYVHNPTSMEAGIYYPSFWAAKKRV